MTEFFKVNTQLSVSHFSNFSKSFNSNMSHPYFYIHNTLDYPSDDGSQQFAISDGLTHGIPPGSLTVPTIPISHGLTATHGIPPGSLVYAGYTPGHGAPIPISHGLTIPHGYYSRYPSSDQSRSLVPRRRHPRSRSQSSLKIWI